MGHFADGFSGLDLFESQEATPSTDPNDEACGYCSSNPVLIVVSFDVAINVIHMLSDDAKDGFES